MYFKPGKTVKVNKDIIRVKRWETSILDGLSGSRPIMEEYAKQGDTGEVIEVFRGECTAANIPGPYFVKVKMGDRIKTFRMTSLEVVK